MNLELSKGALQSKHQKHENVLADLDADVEQQQRQQQLAAGQAQISETARVAEAVDQTEPERHHPGTTDGEAALPPPRADHLNTHEQNRQGDGGIERRRGDAHHPNRRHRQRDAVGHCERRDRFEQRPAIPDDQQQGQHEEQVIHTEQDVLDAQAQIGEGTGLLRIAADRSDQSLALLRLDEDGFRP